MLASCKNSSDVQSDAESVAKAVVSHVGVFSEASHLDALMEASSLGDFSSCVGDFAKASSMGGVSLAVGNKACYCLLIYRFQDIMVTLWNT